MENKLTETELGGCHCCGLVQYLPTFDDHRIAICRRCHTPLQHLSPRRRHLSAALTLSALCFYPPAMLLPMLRIERFGHQQEDSLLAGLAGLFAENYWFTGSVVLLFSVFLPLAKLLILLIMHYPAWINSLRNRAWLYRAVEIFGRWGMLDVMLVAILVAFVKLGNLVSISAGPGLWAFMLLVLSSLLAGATFNPHLLWQSDSR